MVGHGDGGCSAWIGRPAARHGEGDGGGLAGSYDLIQRMWRVAQRAMGRSRRCEAQVLRSSKYAILRGLLGLQETRGRLPRRWPKSRLWDFQLLSKLCNHGIRLDALGVRSLARRYGASSNTDHRAIVVYRVQKLTYIMSHTTPCYPGIPSEQIILRYYRRLAERWQVKRRTAKRE